jgi:hypothetical protein
LCKDRFFFTEQFHKEQPTQLLMDHPSLFPADCHSCVDFAHWSLSFFIDVQLLGRFHLHHHCSGPIALVVVATVMFETMLDIVACGPCSGIFGRWKSKLQDDDADLWLDLSFANHVPDVKPPPIPKVVSILHESDEEDVSTICGATYCGSRRSRQERSETRSASNEEKWEEDAFSAMFGHSLELEVVKTTPHVARSTSQENRSTISSCMDVDDASLESIMGPRSCRSIASSRRQTASCIERQQQRREQYQRFVDSFSRSFNVTEDQKDEDDDDDGSSYSSVRRRLSSYLKRKNGFGAALNLQKATSMPHAVCTHRTHSMSMSTTRTSSTSHTQDKTYHVTNVGGRRIRSIEV